MFNDTVTIFNWHEGIQLWYPHIIHGVAIGESATQDTSATRGDHNGSSVELLVNCTSDKKITAASGVLQYLPPKQYAKLEQPTDFITFTAGKDFLYSGEYESAEPIEDAIDFDSGFFKAMNAEYDGVYKIDSVAFYGLLPHFEIGGR